MGLGILLYLLVAAASGLAPPNEGSSALAVSPAHAKSAGSPGPASANSTSQLRGVLPQKSAEIKFAICSMATGSSKRELLRLLRSIALYYGDRAVYVAVDDEAARFLEDAVEPRLKPRIAGGIVLKRRLARYGGKTRDQMEGALWRDFQMEKATIMRDALEDGHPGALFVDADTYFVRQLPPMGDAPLGLSLQLINKQQEDMYGLYNGGFLFARSPAILEDWRKLANQVEDKLCPDQTALNLLVDRWPHFVVDPGVNVGWYQMRSTHSREGKNVYDRLECKDGAPHFKGYPIYSLHVHQAGDFVLERRAVQKMLHQCNHPMLEKL